MERLTERGEDGKYFVRISGDNDLILGAEERLLPGLEKWTGWWEHTVLGNIVDPSPPTKTQASLPRKSRPCGGFLWRRSCQKKMLQCLLLTQTHMQKNMF